MTDVLKMIVEPATRQWQGELRHELTGHILPFWRNKVCDPYGGFFGMVDSDGVVDRNAPRSAVVNARILWSFAAATRRIGGGLYASSS